MGDCMIALLVIQFIATEIRHVHGVAKTGDYILGAFSLVVLLLGVFHEALL